MRWNTHHSASSEGDQNVISNVHRYRFSRNRISNVSTGEHARLFAIFEGAVEVAHPSSLLSVRGHLITTLSRCNLIH